MNGVPSLARPRLTRRGLLRGIGAALALIPLAGCAGRVDATQPPEIRFGESACASCGMIISDPVYAAGYRTAEGEARLFDDIGEMFLYHRARREPVVAFFVHDYTTRGWLQAENAHYVSSPELRTPMGFGIAAAASAAEAASLAARTGGRTASYQEVLEELDLTEHIIHPRR